MPRSISPIVIYALYMTTLSANDFQNVSSKRRKHVVFAVL